MKDFLQYVIGELKSKRLTKNEAIELIKQYKKRTASEKTGFAHPNASFSKADRNSGSLQGNLQKMLIKIASELLNVNVENIDAGTDFNEYGFDTVLFAEFVDRINREYSIELSPAVFSMYRNLSDLSFYLTEELKVFPDDELPIQAEDDDVASKSETVVLANPEELKVKTIYQLKVLIGEVTDLDVDKIDADEAIERYGIDSLMINQLNRKLSSIFNDLSKTLFYEYRTIESLAEYLISDYSEECKTWAGIEAQSHIEDTDVCGYDELPQRSFTEAKKEMPESRKSIKKDNKTREPIAIIGISGRFPQAENLAEYWENLKEGKDCITEIPPERWEKEGFYHPDMKEAVEQNKSYCKWGGFIDNFADFDPQFFGILPREAINMDPQERLFIQTCWEVLEDAGYTREQLAVKYEGRVGVFAGITKTGYDLYGPELWKQGEKVFPYTSFGSIANRISYIMNLHGPSMPIDTMCSSSLTAVHEACEHIWMGECEMAFAGGVNIYIHPSSYVMLCAQQMLSKDGRCKSFGKGGNGFVPGEGVGVVLLKNLSQAVADGDHIYAVIRGTGINHGGKTSGYTVPNPTAQGDLIRMALDKAGVNARTVSYVEAHGTGTELGDPIEIAGLSKAFGKDTQERGYCAIGSVKSNIGHLEAAAGIAGIAKIVLQMKHKKIVPSLHSRELNPNINFDKTPFVVQQELADWKRPQITVNGETVEYPRIAGISAFGAGGSNAHVVLEEYIPTPDKKPVLKVSPQNPAVILLSAKTEDRLKEQAKRLLDAIENKRYKEGDMADIAYTLQVGREAMEERMALIVSSLKDLKGKLKGFLEGKTSTADIFRGQVKRGKGSVMAFTADEDMEKIIDVWIEKKKYSKILELWVNGLTFDWNRLYGDLKPRRISLPTYPFEKERYWLPLTKYNSTETAASSADTMEFLHPLLHRNTSDLLQQRFSSSFTGGEFFIDHGSRTLPGTIYLEMARAAVKEAAGNLMGSTKGISLKNMVWSRPVILGEQALTVHIGLFSPTDGEVAFEIYSEVGKDHTEPTVYCQGIASLSEVQEAEININEMKNLCSREMINHESYSISTGAVIEKIYMGQGKALARVSLPDSVSDTVGQFELHPYIMNAALQVAAVLTEGPDNPGTLLIHSLEKLEVIDKCTSGMWILASCSDTEGKDTGVSKTDVDIGDDTGRVCLRIKGLLTRTIKVKGVSDNSVDTDNILMLEPRWKEDACEKGTAASYTGHMVILCDMKGVSTDSIEAGMDGVRCLLLESDSNDIEERFESYALELFKEIKGILKDKNKGKVLIQLIVPSQNEGKLLSGLQGLLKTAHLENPKIIGQVIEAECGANSQWIIEKAQENSLNAEDHHVCYKSGKRYTAKWSQIQASKYSEVPWKNRGVYLITGGAGGLGLIFAEEISRQVKNSIVVLTGRSALNEAKKARLEKLEKLGARLIYKQVDVSDKEGLNTLIKGIVQDYGALNGIIHCAGLIRDNYIIRKTGKEFTEVLAPKVRGLLNLDKATADLTLDFFILFSSTAGSLGNPGQSDYSTANAFLDAYAQYRNTLVDSKQRSGRTISINWPLWKDGGMHVDEETEKMMQETIGMVAMQTEAGIKALNNAVAFGKNQVMVIQGDVQRLKEIFLEISPKENIKPDNKATEQIDKQGLADKTINKLKALFAEITGISTGKIDNDEPLENYGIDSIVITRLNQKLSDIFRGLSKTLFYEYLTLRELTGYLTDNHASECISWTGFEAGLQSLCQTAPENLNCSDEFPVLVSFMPGNNQTRSLKFMCSVEKDCEPIAIIGISGRFPQARTLKEFWEKLKEGKDCITEIPEERWPIEGFYHPDVKEAVAQGKSYSKWGGFIDGFAEFDPLFFNISPREAMNIDPQERLFIESCWEVLEDAGYTRDQIKDKYNGKVGVFAGITKTGFELYGPDLWRQGEQLFPYTSFGSVANRVSYFMNLHGPSMPVDTMCSSSLTAVHEACEHIKQGDCEMAFAGGVNLYLHPSSYVGLCAQKMLSRDGRCKSFGKGGNGFVPGEGVGVVLLKSLSKAVADGDHIYAVIRSTSINHGGKTNGYTVPSPVAQAELIRAALDKCGINARAVSYVEAHGTGTELGDPIEITGLTQAFNKDTQDTGYCAIGSVKSNIGHCEAAAGIAGIAKIVLQMKHGKIVPSLHSKELNSNIQFEKTPFVVQQELADWKRPMVKIDGSTVEYPRIAGISSFGAGGSNAHVIIEEFIPKEEGKHIGEVPQKSVIIVLSAKNEERLNERAQQLLTAIREGQFEETHLPNMAYTLQVGREAMEERLALTAGTLKELEEKLEAYLNGDTGIPDVFRGQVKQGKEILAAFADDDLTGTIDTWISKGKYSKLMDIWVKGLSFDWNKLYGSNKPSRISLPTYPFERNSYWLPVTAGKYGMALTPVSAGADIIHPLLHKNTSDVSELRFSSCFTGSEFFMAEYNRKGRKTMAWPAYVEMACNAVEKAAGEFYGKNKFMQLKNIEWVEPITVENKPLEVSIGIFPEKNGEIAFEIYGKEENNHRGTVIYCTGYAIQSVTQEPTVVDIGTIQKQCSNRLVSQEQCAEMLRRMGARYDTGVIQLYMGEDRLLVKLSLPEPFLDTQDNFYLHPLLMDLAVQAAYGFMKDHEVIGSVMPFSLDRIDVYSRCMPVMWAYIKCDNMGEIDPKRLDLNIDLCNEKGTVCARVNGLKVGEYPERNDSIISVNSIETALSARDEAAAGTVQEEAISVSASAGKGRRAEMRGLSIEQCLEWDLKEQVSKLLGIPHDKLGTGENLSDFGFDSISLAEFASVLTGHYGIEITPALFFGYSTIDKLIEYFITEHKEIIHDFYREASTQKVDVSRTPAVNPPVKCGSHVRTGFFGIGNKSINEPIAIIGMSGRFPQARDINEMWEILLEGRNAVGEVPLDRFDWKKISNGSGSEDGGASNKWYCGCIPGVREFDPLFFEISPKEAETMDPRQRLLLQEAWNALEDAAYGTAEIKKRKIGMFVGAEDGDYDTLTKGKGGITSNHNAVLSARLAYFLNLSGPNMAINTACSSSLVAVHQACLSLRNNECDTAIAAGASLLLTPGAYIGMAQAGMLSQDGKCYTFDKRANGMVPGEAVAAVVLKRLSDAEADGDPIYAVIRGSGINYDGKTNGITAPSGVSQTSLLKSVYDRYNINPEEIEYIVTHGTGTKLGDPIEINALYDAFKNYTQKQGYCALTSCKTNFGHALAASGLVSLINLVQALHNKVIPASLNCEQENDYINWRESPFYVNKTRKEWLKDDGKARLGAVSAFGMSGTNVHMVLEEYIYKEHTSSINVPYYLFPFSAKTDEVLQEKVNNAILLLESREWSANDLASMSLTLMEGRQHFSHRCAVVIKDREDAIHILKKVCNREKSPNIFQGKTPKDFKGQDVLQQYVSDILSMCSSSKSDTNRYRELLYALAELYCQGYEVKLSILYQGEKVYRMHMPTYPFAKEQYWVEDESLNTSVEGAAFIHPLLHSNTSDLSEQRFTTTFTGGEYYEPDYLVKGRKSLPGIAHLEMAHEAVKQAAGYLLDINKNIQLKNITWTETVLFAEQPLQVHTALYQKENGEIVFEIYSNDGQNGEETLIYSSGSAVICHESQLPSVDIKALQQQCTRSILSSSQCSEMFKALGANYSAGIRQLYLGEGIGLSRLSLPDVLSDTLEKFTVHPVILDMAIQASEVIIENSDRIKPLIPVSMQEAEVFGKCTSSMWAVFRYNAGSYKQESMQIMDIDLCDEQGRICIRIKGLKLMVSSDTGREIDSLISPVDTSDLKDDKSVEMMTFEEEWIEEALTGFSSVDVKSIICFLSEEENRQAFKDSVQARKGHMDIVFVSQGEIYQKQSCDRYIINKNDKDAYTQTFNSIVKDFAGVDAIFYLWPLEDKDSIYDCSAIVHIIQAAAKEKLRPRTVMFSASFEDGLERCYLDSWVGFERSLGLIIPDARISGVYLSCENGTQKVPASKWFEILLDELNAAKAQSAMYLGDKRYVSRIRKTELSTGGSLLKTGGTYLITGGCGGLGLVFAGYLAKTRSANLILTGRSPLDQEKKFKLEKLENLGSRVMYLQADVCDLKEMQKGLNSARELFGGINGVIHAAGIPGRKSIFEKDINTFNRILEPKITGTLVLDQLLKEESLDFICYFTSTSAVLGDFGSCDYAVGNRFQMAYARYRNEMQSKGEIRGKAVAINWPLWKDGGMGFNNDENTKMYLKSSGQRFLETDAGTDMFEKLLWQSGTQHLVLYGQPERVHRFLGLSEPTHAVTVPKVIRPSGKGRVTEMDGLSTEQCLEWDLKEQVSRLLKIPRDRLDMEENLSDFGFDSISLADFATVLTGHFGIEITPSLFFGYPTLEKLKEYFLEEHREKVYGFYSEGDVEHTVVQKPSEIKVPARKPRPGRARIKPCGVPDTEEPIAIIGMSGRFPKARNVDEMWNILFNGQNAVDEIPLERFDWRKYTKGHNGETENKWYCGCIPGVSEFDPLFFEISPNEAETMDPRQRLMLEEAWKALEDAGYGASKIKSSKIGMYVGVEDGDYGLLSGGKGSITSNNTAILAARLSYFLNLNGPNMAINTACSSGLVAAHQACQSLRNNECDTAIAAGVNMLLSPTSYNGMYQAGMLSKDGRCYTFDKRANGMVPGEAVAVLVLKRLSRAEADGDSIYAVIKGSGVNYDGKTNGITAPSGVSQTSLLKSVYDRYKINPEEIEYIVAHGTGTKLGDPVEINALNDAFKVYTQKQRYCALTSTKTNFGHSLAASGLVSLISLVQALKNETIPASLNCEHENDFINWDRSPFFVNKKNRAWPAKDGKIRMGAVSAFGMSGTNAHMVLQGYERKAVSEYTAPCYLLVLSAKTQEALKEKIDDMAALLEKTPGDTQMSGISYTLLEGRHHFDFRFAAVVKGREDAIYLLRKAYGMEKLPNVFSGKVARDFKGSETIKQYSKELLKESQLYKNDSSKYREILYALAELYCQGYEMDWTGLFGDVRPTVVHLPTYPFAREKYWISSGDEKAYLAPVQSSQEFDEAYYERLLDGIIEDMEGERGTNYGSGNMGVISSRRGEE